MKVNKPTVYGFEMFDNQFLGFFDEINIALQNLVTRPDQRTMTLEQAVDLIRSKGNQYQVSVDDMDLLINEVERMW